MTSPKPRAVVIGNSTYFKPFLNLGCSVPPESKENIKNADFVVLTGGPDVTPNLYGDDQHTLTHPPFDDRDKREKEIFLLCQQYDIPMLGICRGAQFLNVMSGGKLWQDVTNHQVSKHPCRTFDGFEFSVNSTHHQMMYPWTAKYYKMIAWSNGLSSHYLTGSKLKGKLKVRTRALGKNKVAVVEPEIVWFPHTSCLCVQYHPERLNSSDPAFQYFKDLVKEYML